jgi:hypothetical protein
MKSKLYSKALDLMIEDLYTKNIDIRVTAKKLGCEEELDLIKEQLLVHLNSLKQTS